MQKPVTITRNELKEKLAEDINTYGLPFFITRGILEELLEAVREGEKRQLELDIKKYTEFLEEQKAKDEAASNSEKEEQNHGD